MGESLLEKSQLDINIKPCQCVCHSKVSSCAAAAASQPVVDLTVSPCKELTPLAASEQSKCCSVFSFICGGIWNMHDCITSPHDTWPLVKYCIYTKTNTSPNNASFACSRCFDLAFAFGLKHNPDYIHDTRGCNDTNKSWFWFLYNLILHLPCFRPIHRDVTSKETIYSLSSVWQDAVQPHSWLRGWRLSAREEALSYCWTSGIVPLFYTDFTVDKI